MDNRKERKIRRTKRIGNLWLKSHSSWTECWHGVQKQSWEWHVFLWAYAMSKGWDQKCWTLSFHRVFPGCDYLMFNRLHTSLSGKWQQWQFRQRLSFWGLYRAWHLSSVTKNQSLLNVTKYFINKMTLYGQVTEK